MQNNQISSCDEDSDLLLKLSEAKSIEDLGLTHTQLLECFKKKLKELILFKKTANSLRGHNIKRDCLSSENESDIDFLFSSNSSVSSRNINSIHNNITNISSRYNQNTDIINEQLQKLEEKIRKLCEKNKKLNLKIAEQNALIYKLQNQSNTSRSYNDIFEESAYNESYSYLDNSYKSIETSSMDTQILQNKINKYEITIQSLEQQVETYRNIVKKLNDDIILYADQSKVHEIKEKISKLELEKEHLVRKNSHLKDKLQSKENIIKEIKEKYKKLKAQSEINNEKNTLNLLELNKEKEANSILQHHLMIRTKDLLSYERVNHPSKTFGLNNTHSNTETEFKPLNINPKFLGQ